MRAHLLLACVALFAPTERDIAIDKAVMVARFAEQNRPVWWRWTCWLAAGITVRRIEAA